MIAPSTQQFRAETSSLPDEIEITVPPAAPFPAVLLQTNNEQDPAAAMTPAQQKLADRLATEFARDVRQSEADNGAVEEAVFEGWRNATNKANGKFRSLFGREAYIREDIRQYQLRK